MTSKFMALRSREVRDVVKEPLVSHSCGFKSLPGVWILSCEEDSKLANRTSVVLLMCLNNARDT